MLCMWKRIRINSVLCMKCRKWIHGQCTKWKKVTSAFVKSFACKRCKMMRNEMSVERSNDDKELLKDVLEMHYMPVVVLK